MEVNIAQLMKSSIGAERLYDVDEAININGEEVQVKGKVKLVRTDRGILATGLLDAKLIIECSRCLQPFEYPVNINFEEEYFPNIDVITGLEVEIPEDQPLSFTIDEHHLINLDEAIKQYAILAIPMKPLCQTDCPGLCPTCGKNLNTGPCGCSSEEQNQGGLKIQGLFK
ncbi:MAG: DUF177 domain-containing protein [Dehalococcoidales bacterium]|nr:DUF177 domain-containing protein [Dehalococcoidales bacterium]